MGKKKSSPFGKNFYENDMLNLLVYLCLSQAEFEFLLKKYKVLEKKDYVSGPGRVHSIEEPGGFHVHIICIRPNNSKPELLKTLVHECVHVWQYHKDWIGETADAWELEAYFICGVFNAFRQQLSKKRWL